MFIYVGLFSVLFNKKPTWPYVSSAESLNEELEELVLAPARRSDTPAIHRYNGGTHSNTIKVQNGQT